MTPKDWTTADTYVEADPLGLRVTRADIYAVQARVANALARVASAQSVEALYSAYDEIIAPVFDHVPAELLRQVNDAIEARRPELQGK